MRRAPARSPAPSGRWRARDRVRCGAPPRAPARPARSRFRARACRASAATRQQRGPAWGTAKSSRLRAQVSGPAPGLRPTPWSSVRADVSDFRLPTCRRTSAFSPVPPGQTPGLRNTPHSASALRTPRSALRTPHSALRIPHSTLRNPNSAIRIPQSEFRSPSSEFQLRTPHSELRTSPHSPLRTPHFSTCRTCCSARPVRTASRGGTTRHAVRTIRGSSSPA